MKKKALVLILTAMVLCALASLAEARVFNWTKEGVSPFWHQPVQSNEELKALFRSQAFKNKLAAGIGIEAARAAETSVLNNQAAKTAYPSGTEFDWMLYGPGTTPKKINETVRWSGDHDLVGFIIPLGQEAIFIGSRCVNILKPRIVKSEIPGEYIERTQMQKKVVVQQPQQEEENEEIVIVQQSQPRQKKIIYVYVNASGQDCDYNNYNCSGRQEYYDQGYNNGCGNGNSGFGFPLPPRIFGGRYSYDGGYDGGGRGNYGRGGYSGRSSRGGQQQSINIVNSNTSSNTNSNRNSSSSYSRATGGRVNFNSSINNRQSQSMSNRQSFRGGRSQQNCPSGNCGSGQPARR